MPRIRGEWHSLCSVFLLTLLLIVGASTGPLQVENSANNGGSGILVNPDERDMITAQEQKDDRSSTTNGVTASVVFMNSVLMAAANCLGALPFLFVKQLSKDIIGVANAVACGVMLACSFDLLHEGEQHGPVFLVAGLLIGMFCVKWTQAYLERFETIKFEALEGADARKTLLVVGIMAAHAVGEGAGVGVSYSGDSGWSQGLLVTLAIGLHNVPEGLAVSTVLISRGVPLRRAVLWNFASAIPQAIFALPAYLFVEMFKNCLPVALGFAAGCMIWVVFSELLPDAYDNTQPSKIATTATLSAVCLEAARMGMNALEAGNFPNLGLEDVTVQQLAMLATCFVACSSFAFLVQRLIPAKPFSTGIGVGMQCGLCLATLLKLFFQSSVPAFSCFMWVSLGCAFGTLDWRNVSSKRKWGQSAKQSDCLPLTQRWLQVSHFFENQLLQDPAIASLVGLGIIDGVYTGSILQPAGNDWHRVLILTVIRSFLFGAMLGLLLLQLRTHQHTSVLLGGMISLIPGATAMLMIYSEALLSKPVMRFVALISGFVLLSACRAIFSKKAPLFQQGARFRQSSTMPVVYETEDWVDNPIMDASGGHELSFQSKSRLYHSLGVLFGAGIAVAGLLLLEVL